MKHSLSAKITIVFAIAFIVVSALFFIIYELQSEREIDKVRANQYNSINWLISLYEKSSMPENWERYFKNFDLEYVKDQKLLKEIIKFGKALDRTKTSIGIIETVRYKNKLYLNLKNENISIILQSTLKSQLNGLMIIFLFSIVLIVSLYISILKNLAPLRSLRDDMRKFASGNMDGLKRTKIIVKDEITGRSSVTLHLSVCDRPTVKPRASPLAVSMRRVVLRDFTPKAFITHVAASGERVSPQSSGCFSLLTKGPGNWLKLR